MTYIQTNLVSSCQPEFHTNMVVTQKNNLCLYVGMKNRVREIRNSLGLSQEKFGEILGITYIQVGRLERGERQLREQTMRLYAERLNKAGYNVLPTDFFASAESDQTDEEKALLETYRQMTDHDQKIYLSMGAAFLKGNDQEQQKQPEKKRKT